MSQLIVQTFVSLDGVMQGPGGPEEDRSDGFARGGWLVPYFDEAMGRTMVDWTGRADAVLFGRKTYEILAGHWPRVGDDDPIAAKLNSVRKYVVSTTLDTVDWNNSTLIEGDVAAAVAELKRQPGGEIQVTGSGELIQTLMRHDLVDEYRLMIFPVLVGSGKRLFAGGTMPAALELVDTATSSTGVAIHTYRRAGELQHGSFALDQ
jgi:dihydrofolate reductase